MLLSQIYSLFPNLPKSAFTLRYPRDEVWIRLIYQNKPLLIKIINDHQLDLNYGPMNLTPNAVKLAKINHWKLQNSKIIASNKTANLAPLKFVAYFIAQVKSLNQNQIN